MKFNELLQIVEREPVFGTGHLLAGDIQPAELYQQLSLWKKAGRIIQLRRGLYALAPPYQKVQPHPFVIANRMVRSSYVSCQSALAYAGHIPEWVPVVTSVTTGRPGLWQTQLGSFQYQHIKTELFSDYRWFEVYPAQHAFVATPEKALLDLIHLQPGGDSPEYISELRLQHMETFDLDEFAQLASHAGRPKMERTVPIVRELVQSEMQDFRAVEEADRHRPREEARS